MTLWRVTLRAWPELGRNAYDHANMTLQLRAENEEEAREQALRMVTGKLAPWVYQDAKTLRQYTKVRVMRVSRAGADETLTSGLKEAPDAPPYEEFMAQIQRKRMAALKQKRRVETVLRKTKLAKANLDD